MTPQYLQWRKASRSEANGACVEVAPGTDGTVGVRDTKAQDTGPILNLTRADWIAFVTRLHHR